MTTLREVAPRLAKAQEQYIEAKRRRRLLERRLTNERLRLQRLIEHRELAFLRSGAVVKRSTKNKIRHTQERAKKLEEAKKRLELVERKYERQIKELE